MTDSELKRRTIRCTNAEWGKIVRSAEKMGLSPGRFIIEKTCSDGDDDEPNPSDLTRILNCSRLVAFDLMDRLRANHSLEEFNLILGRTNNEYVTLDELKKNNPLSDS